MNRWRHRRLPRDALSRPRRSPTALSELDDGQGAVTRTRPASQGTPHLQDRPQQPAPVLDVIKGLGCGSHRPSTPVQPRARDCGPMAIYSRRDTPGFAHSLRRGSVRHGRVAAQGPDPRGLGLKPIGTQGALARLAGPRTGPSSTSNFRRASHNGLNARGDQDDEGRHQRTASQRPWRAWTSPRTASRVRQRQLALDALPSSVRGLRRDASHFGAGPFRLRLVADDVEEGRHYAHPRPTPPSRRLP
jgi:hypothetical protein